MLRSLVAGLLVLSAVAGEVRGEVYTVPISVRSADTASPMASTTAGRSWAMSYTSGNGHHAFLYSDGEMTDLGTLGGS